MLKLFQRSLLNRAPQLNPRSAFHTTTVTNLKRILVNEDANTKVIKIDAEYMPESGQPALKFAGDQNQNIKPCAFCELGYLSLLVIEVVDIWANTNQF